MMRPSKFLLAVTCLLAGLSPISAQTPTGAAVAGAELRRLIRDIDEAHRRGAAAVMERLFAADFELTDARGAIINRTQALAAWQAGRVGYETYDSADVRVRVYGLTAVVTALTTRKSRTDAGDAGQFQITRVFVKRCGGWQMVASHTTRLTSP